MLLAEVAELAKAVMVMAAHAPMQKKKKKPSDDCGNKPASPHPRHEEHGCYEKYEKKTTLKITKQNSLKQR